MATLEIFCPNNHLIMDRLSCPTCGWGRAKPAEPGSLAWGPLETGRVIGGPTPSMIVPATLIQDRLVIPAEDGQVLVGIDVKTGATAWQQSIEPGCKARFFSAAQQKGFVSICDERSLELSSQGWVAELDPNDGSLTRIWTARSPVVGQVVLSDDTLVVRTGDSRLLAFRGRDMTVPLWQQPLETWWAAANPVIVDGKVVICDGKPFRGEGYLIGYDLASGEQSWKFTIGELLPYQPRIEQGMLLYGEGKQRLTGRRISDGALVWQQNYSRIYTSVATGDGLAYVVVRGNEDPKAADHYLLQAFQPIDGAVLWKHGLPEKARQLIFCEAGQLLVADDGGRISAYRASDGSLSWETRLGADEDPLGLVLTAVENMLVAATISGRIAAYWLEPPPLNDALLAHFIEDECWANAASVLALTGDLQRAADLYETRLADPEKAYQLLEHGQLWERAGELAMQQDWYERALSAFASAGNRLGQARANEALRRYPEAARFYEQEGELEKSAGCYLLAGDYANVYRLYAQTGNVTGIQQIFSKLPQELQIQSLGLLPRARKTADLACTLKQYRLAANIFNALHLDVHELDALRAALQEEDDPELMERVAVLAHKLRNFDLEAEAWHSLHNDEKEAQALFLSAQLEESGTDRKDAAQRQNLIKKYELALEAAQRSGNAEFIEMCQTAIDAIRPPVNTGIFHKPPLDVIKKDPGGRGKGKLAQLQAPEPVNVKDIFRCILRILDSDGETRGTGFVLINAAGESLAVTCAHVIAGINSEPGATIRIQYCIDQSESTAVVLKDGWSPVEQQDAAFLRLKTVPEEINGLRLALPDSSNGNHYWSFGFKEEGDNVEGYWAEGKILGVAPRENGIDSMQLEGNEVSAGFSGAPVFDEKLMRVVGMVQWGREDKYVRTVRALPVSGLKALYPALPIDDPGSIEESREPRLLSVLEKNQIVDALLMCKSIYNYDSRQDIVANLPPQIKFDIDHSANARGHTVNIVNTCVRYPDGLDKLVELIVLTEGETRPVIELKKLMDRLGV